MRKNTRRILAVVDCAERRKGTKEPGACVSLLERGREVPPLGQDRVQQEQANVAHRAKVTGGCDRESFSLATDEDTTTM